MGIALRLARALAPLHRGAAETASGRELDKKLVKAGRPFGMTAAEFLCLRYVGAGAGVFVGWMLSTQATATGEVDPTYVVPLAIFGFLYPQLRLRAVIARRQLRVFRDLPYVLDLLTLSTEAGQDFSSAMAMVVDKGPPGPLVDEFRIAHQEVTLGKTRTESLRAMAARIDVPELTSFVLALIQAGELGSSIGRVLRIMAEQMRVKRSSLAEEAAGKVPVKLMAPLILLIFPASFIILFVPLYLRSQLSGGF
jgi:tight adherence protein C